MPHLRDGFIVAKVGIRAYSANHDTLSPVLDFDDKAVEAEDGAPGIFDKIQPMPLGLKRYQTEGHLHFLTFSCYQRDPYFNTPEAKDIFETSLESARKKYQFDVLAYVVMPEHVHLLVTEPEEVLLFKAILALKLSVSKRSKQRPFWQDRYYDFNVTSYEKKIEKIRYIHRNPVTRGLVEKKEDWKWSSFRFYSDNERGTVTINPR